MSRKPPKIKKEKPNLADLRERASATVGYAVDDGDVALAVINTDVDGLYDKHKKRIEWEVWNKTTPINGVDPAMILGRQDYNGGEIYLIYIDGELVFLQPHAPDGNGPIDAADVDDVAGNHAGQVVNEFVETELVQTVVDTSVPPTPTVDLDDLQALLGRGRFGRQERPDRGLR